MESRSSSEDESNFKSNEKKSKFEKLREQIPEEILKVWET